MYEMTREDMIEFATMVGNAERVAQLHGMTDAEYESERRFREEQAIKDSDRDY